MKAVVAAFNQEKALIGAFSVIKNLRMELFEALLVAGGERRHNQHCTEGQPSPAQPSPAQLQTAVTPHSYNQTHAGRHLLGIPSTQYINIVSLSYDILCLQLLDHLDVVAFLLLRFSLHPYYIYCDNSSNKYLLFSAICNLNNIYLRFYVFCAYFR